MHFYKQRQAQIDKNKAKAKPGPNWQKNQAKAKQHPEAELLLFQNYLLSSSTLSSKKTIVKMKMKNSCK